MPLPQGAPPSAHPSSSETKVTEFGANPWGTPPDSSGVGDGGGVAARVAVADGDGLGLGDEVSGNAEHAASKRHAAPAQAVTNRVEIPICVITRRNAARRAGVTRMSGRDARPNPRRIQAAQPALNGMSEHDFQIPRSIDRKHVLPHFEWVEEGAIAGLSVRGARATNQADGELSAETTLLSVAGR